MNKRALSVRVVFLLITLDTLLWLALGLIIAVDAHPALPVQPNIKTMMAILSLVAAGALLGLSMFLAKRNRVAYYLTLAFFLVASLLIILDEMGWIDLVVLAIQIIPIILLLKERTWYLRQIAP